MFENILFRFSIIRKIHMFLKYKSLEMCKKFYTQIILKYLLLNSKHQNKVFQNTSKRIKIPCFKSKINDFWLERAVLNSKWNVSNGIILHTTINHATHSCHTSKMTGPHFCLITNRISLLIFLLTICMNARIIIK